jgi:sec-independent protein translocase protein TatC
MKSKNNEAGSNAEKANEMTFWEHLTELRTRLFRVLLSVLVFSVGAFVYSRFIFDKILLAPKSSDFITYKWLCSLGRLIHVDSLCIQKVNIEIININLSGQFMTDMYISIFAGIIIAMPYIFWQAWMFIKPALYAKEQKYARSSVFVMSALFFLGVLFSYYFMVPWTLNFLGTYQVSASVSNQITLSSYISTVVSVILSVGVVFELPVVVYVLAKIGILSSSFLKKSRKYAFIIVLIVAAVITPPDVFSQIIVTVPLWLLYEVSILVAKRVEPKEMDSDTDES